LPPKGPAHPGPLLPGRRGRRFRPSSLRLLLRKQSCGISLSPYSLINQAVWSVQKLRHTRRESAFIKMALFAAYLAAIGRPVGELPQSAAARPDGTGDHEQ